MKDWVTWQWSNEDWVKSRTNKGKYSVWTSLCEPHWFFTSIFPLLFVVLLAAVWHLFQKFENYRKMCFEKPSNFSKYEKENTMQRLHPRPCLVALARLKKASTNSINVFPVKVSWIWGILGVSNEYPCSEMWKEIENILKSTCSLKSMQPADGSFIFLVLHVEVDLHYCWLSFSTGW